MPKRRFDLADRELLAAIMRERIYGSVTVHAVNIGLLLKAGLNVEHAFIAIISTVVGLWLAGLFASVLSYRIVHQSNMPRREFAHEIVVHRGILMAGSSSIFMLILAAIGIISLHTAILTDIVLTIASMTVLILRTTTKNASNTFVTAAISIALQAGIVALIILLKLGSK